MSNQVFVYDFTIPQKSTTKKIIEEFLRLHCKKWSFQLEEGVKTGYIHYQGRFSLLEKKRQTAVQKMFFAAGITGFHISITSNANYDNLDYVTKDFTRVDGPWSHMDSPTERILRRHAIIAKGFYPWQQTVIDKSDINKTDIDIKLDKFEDDTEGENKKTKLEKFEAAKLSAKFAFDRVINVILDKRGNHGKSVFCSYLQKENMGALIPYADTYTAIVQMAFGMAEYIDGKIAMIDLPRGLKDEKLNQLYAAIEQIKSGELFDPRYNFKFISIEQPSVWVFANVMPNISYLSKDRWVFWNINDNHELIKIDRKTLKKTLKDEEDRKASKMADQPSGSGLRS